MANSWDNGKNLPRFELGIGKHMFKYNGKRIWITLDTKHLENERFTKRMITMRVMFSNRKFLNSMLDDIIGANLGENKNSLLFL